MDTSLHDFKALFEQLGLPSDEQSVSRFISTHSPLTEEIRLDEAGFWSEAQAAFIREAFEDDSDWAEIVDQLDARLRG